MRIYKEQLNKHISRFFFVPLYMRVLLLLLFLSVSVFWYVARATTLGPNSPATTANDTATGTQAWSSTDNAKVNDGVFATTAALGCGGNQMIDAGVSIVKAGSVQSSTNLASTTNNWPTTESYYSYGSSTELWGQTWTAADINDSGFGLALAARQPPGSPGAQVSNYLKVTNFGFSIPAGAIVTGIQVDIERARSSGLGGSCGGPG